MTTKYGEAARGDGGSRPHAERSAFSPPASGISTISAGMVGTGTTCSIMRDWDRLPGYGECTCAGFDSERLKGFVSAISKNPSFRYSCSCPRTFNLFELGARRFLLGFFPPHAPASVQSWIHQYTSPIPSSFALQGGEYQLSAIPVTAPFDYAA